MNIENRFSYFLAIAGEPTAAAVLVLAEATAAAQPPDAMNVADAAKRLGVSTDLVRKLVREGKLEHQRVGRAIRITANDLADYQVGSAPKPKRVFRALKAS